MIFLGFPHVFPMVSPGGAPKGAPRVGSAPGDRPHGGVRLQGRPGEFGQVPRRSLGDLWETMGNCGFMIDITDIYRYISRYKWTIRYLDL
jgi:hypothetical protein